MAMASIQMMGVENSKAYCEGDGDQVSDSFLHNMPILLFFMLYIVCVVCLIRCYKVFRLVGYKAEIPVNKLVGIELRALA